MSYRRKIGMNFAYLGAVYEEGSLDSAKGVPSSALNRPIGMLYGEKLSIRPRAQVLPGHEIGYLPSSAHWRSELHPKKKSNGGWPTARSVRHVEVDPPLMLTLYGHTVQELFASAPIPGGHEPSATASRRAYCTLVHA